MRSHTRPRSYRLPRTPTTGAHHTCPHITDPQRSLFGPPRGECTRHNWGIPPPRSKSPVAAWSKRHPRKRSAPPRRRGTRRPYILAPWARNTACAPHAESIQERGAAARGSPRRASLARRLRGVRRTTPRSREEWARRKPQRPDHATGRERRTRRLGPIAPRQPAGRLLELDVRPVVVLW